ncbi:MAG: hypothetical protein R3Y06_08365 [Faecalibacterium sp.]
MTNAERYKRHKAVKVADSINKIEGVPVSAKARNLSARWANGEISEHEMKQALLDAHRRPKLSEQQCTLSQYQISSK